MDKKVLQLGHIEENEMDIRNTNSFPPIPTISTAIFQWRRFIHVKFTREVTKHCGMMNVQLRYVGVRVQRSYRLGRAKENQCRVMEA